MTQGQQPRPARRPRALAFPHSPSPSGWGQRTGGNTCKNLCPKVRATAEHQAKMSSVETHTYVALVSCFKVYTDFREKGRE